MHFLTMALRGVTSYVRRRPAYRWLLVLAVGGIIHDAIDGGLLDSGWAAAALAICLIALFVFTGDRRLQRGVGAPTTGSDRSAAVLAAEVKRRRAAEAELDAVRHSLEELVRQRTRELERANSVLLVQQEQLTHLAMHDGLTGLPNRRLFLELLCQEQERVRRCGSRFALLLADLDQFKLVNDRLGHAAGDQLLVQVAQRLTAAVRASDVAARLGGDEFAILMREPGDDGALAALAARIKAAIEAPSSLRDLPMSIGLSLGMAVFPDEADNLNALFELADQRLYADKQRRVARKSSSPLRLVLPPSPARGELDEATSCGNGRE